LSVFDIFVYFCREYLKFSDHELMIVVAIIGILAAIAIPQYQTFIAKSQVSRVVGETGALKTAVEVCLNSGRLAVGTAAGECDPGATPSSVSGDPGGIPAELTAGQALAVDMTITTNFGGTASAALVGTQVQWTRTAAGEWSCASTADEKYKAAGC